MASKEVAERSSSVPALASTPALTITAEDIALPRIYLGQFMSKAVQDQLVKPGSIYAAIGSEDPNPVVLVEPGATEGVRFYVLNLKKGKSIQDSDGELQLFDFDDQDAPPEAWVTYNYTIYVPAADEDVPCKILLTRTGRAAALQMNTVLAKNSAAGPAWELAFELTCQQRENTKGKFFVPRIKQVDAIADESTKAAELFVQLSSAPTEYASTGEQPAI